MERGRKIGTGLDLTYPSETPWRDGACGSRATNEVGLSSSSSSIHHPGHRSTQSAAKTRRPTKREACVRHAPLHEELFVAWLVFLVQQRPIYSLVHLVSSEKARYEVYGLLRFWCGRWSFLHLGGGLAALTAVAAQKKGGAQSGAVRRDRG